MQREQRWERIDNFRAVEDVKAPRSTAYGQLAHLCHKMGRQLESADP
jgi:hypothetical protein